jgi:YggT family protein
VHTFLYIIYIAAMIYGWLIVLRALLSWFRVRPDHPLVRIRWILISITEPYLRLFRRILPTPRVGAVGIDLSTLAGLIVLFVVIQVVVRI